MEVIIRGKLLKFLSAVRVKFGCRRGRQYEGYYRTRDETLVCCVRIGLRQLCYQFLLAV
jgi:hypothetical protein